MFREQNFVQYKQNNGYFFAVAGYNFIKIIDVSVPEIVATIDTTIGSPYGISYGSGKIVATDYTTTSSILVLDAADYSVVYDISYSGDYPTSITYNNVQDVFAVAASATGSYNVDILDTNSGTIVGTITTAVDGPISVAYGNSKYITAHYGSSTDVEIFNASTLSSITTLTSGSYPDGIAYGNSKFCVCNYIDDTATLIDASTDSVITSLSVSSRPYINSVGYTSGKFAVAGYSGNGLTFIDASSDTVIGTTTLSGGYPIGVAGGNGYFVVCNQGLNTVDILSASSYSLITTINVGDITYGVTYIKP